MYKTPSGSSMYTIFGPDVSLLGQIVIYSERSFADRRQVLWSVFKDSTANEVLFLLQSFPHVILDELYLFGIWSDVSSAELLSEPLTLIFENHDGRWCLSQLHKPTEEE